MNTPSRVEYWNFDGFAYVYLEDSWVLSVAATPHRLLIDCDLVLREGHEEYTPPATDEAYCYRRAEIAFDAVTSLLGGAPMSFVKPSGAMRWLELAGGQIGLWVGSGNFRLEGPLG